MRTRLARSLALVATVLGLIAGMAVPASANNSEKYNGLNIHWNRVGTSLAQVYFVDTTPARWPVNSSVVTWNSSSRVKSYYVTSCPNSTVNCVVVSEYSSTTDGFYGYTQFQPVMADSNGHIRKAVSVHLNKAVNTGAADDRQTVCQETGHVLGLDHQYQPDTCMSDATHNVKYPNTHDYNQLAAVYNH